MNSSKSHKSLRNRWEWQDDDGTYKRYDHGISAQIEGACKSGFKKYFFVSSLNQNSYEIDFTLMMQSNVQTGKQRKVKRVALEPKWKGPGPNPKKWTGPTDGNRRIFGKNIMDLYCVIGQEVAKEVKCGGKLIRGTLGPFGSGLYFYDSKEIAIHMAKHRMKQNRGQILSAKVIVGEMEDVSTMDDKQYDFRTLQQLGKDSVTRTLGFGNEYIVYNADQVCVVNVEKY